MNLETRAKISKSITDIVSLFKILLAIFLIIVVSTWLIQFLEIEVLLPFTDGINDKLTQITSLFYTSTKDDEESFDALLYLSIAIVLFLLIFETLTDILGDILKLHAKHQEAVLAEENARINRQIQKNYKKHLSTSFNFSVILKLEVNNPLNSTQAFKDENLEQKIKHEEQKIIKDIYSIITMSLKCPISARPDMIIINLNTADELNKILNFITSVCNVEKYLKKGVQYYMTVTTHSPNEPATIAIQEGIKLLELKYTNKILCHEIVCECLKQVKNCHFRFENNGSYSTSENETIFEIINKN